LSYLNLLLDYVMKISMKQKLNLKVVSLTFQTYLYQLMKFLWLMLLRVT